MIATLFLSQLAIFEHVTTLAPELDKIRAAHISVLIEKNARIYRLKPLILSSILHLESRYKLDAYNKRSKDYGIGQINENNIKSMGLSKWRLLNDLEYSIEASAKILSYFKNRYKDKLGKNWLAKYNCGTRHRCETTKKSKTYIRLVYSKH